MGERDGGGRAWKAHLGEWGGREALMGRREPLVLVRATPDHLHGHRQDNHEPSIPPQGRTWGGRCIHGGMVSIDKTWLLSVVYMMSQETKSSQ